MTEVTRRPSAPAPALTKTGPAIRRGSRSLASHVLRGPWYALLLLARIPRGLHRMTAGVVAWANDRVNDDYWAAQMEAQKHKFDELLAKREARIAGRRGRVLVLAGVACLAVVGLDWWVGAWTWQVLLGVLVFVAAVVGGKRPAGAVPGEASGVHIIDEAARLQVTPDAIVFAFTAALPAVAKAFAADPKALALLGPVHRDGPGWAATVELPLGVTLVDCVRAREALASALRVMGDQLYLSAGRHAGQCRMWVADDRPCDMAAVEWAYAGADRVSLADPVPIGATAKGTPVTLSMRTKAPDGRTIVGGSMLVGGVSGSGKTTYTRMIVSAAVLDPDATIAIFDGKGDGDYAAFAPATDWMRVGATPDNLAALHVMLEQAQAEMRARQQGLSPRTPLLIVIDEVQRIRDKDTLALIEDLLRVGRSSGIFLLLATQKPSAESLPTDLRDSVRTRVCLKVHNQATNDMILGTGAYSEGRDASKFTTGMALVLDVDTDAVDIVRVALVTEDMARRIAAAHPRASGRMFPDPGSVEDTIEIPAVIEARPLTVVDQVIGVWPVGQERASTEELARALGWGEGVEVTRRLREFGVITRPLWIDGKTQRGLERAVVEAAAGAGVSL